MGRFKGRCNSMGRVGVIVWVGVRVGVIVWVGIGVGVIVRVEL
jgi:hypothetical protein